MFDAYPRHGFAVTFANGYTLSVIWHSGSYSSRKNPSETAEVAVWDKNGRGDKFPGVAAWQTPEDVANWFKIVSELPVVI